MAFVDTVREVFLASGLGGSFHIRGPGEYVLVLPGEVVEAGRIYGLWLSVLIIPVTGRPKTKRVEGVAHLRQRPPSGRTVLHQILVDRATGVNVRQVAEQLVQWTRDQRPRPTIWEQLLEGAEM